MSGKTHAVIQVLERGTAPRCPCGKLGHESEQAARRALKRTGARLRFYTCEHGRWHGANDEKKGGSQSHRTTKAISPAHRRRRPRTDAGAPGLLGKMRRASRAGSSRGPELLAAVERVEQAVLARSDDLQDAWAAARSLWVEIAGGA